MVGTSPGRFAGTACCHKYQLVMHPGETAAPLWRDRERSVIPVSLPLLGREIVPTDQPFASR
ncbi:hypothetical protein [Streptomyces brasiliensis]|uniref:Uncharacterized protein n=1 Tax=Streptomyces brasiliensis TaxID=1954 RepID=A0A917UPC1_9ACTN|nr:hypothetical protein [Streptomyces brasiliensis]GGJ72745.1 hypothetical protein GCM10010121_099210 [Streptomyces brasiliensis]